MPPKTPPAGPRPTRVSGALPGFGHSAEFLANPALFMLRAWREWTLAVPDEVTSEGRLLRLPPLPELPEPLRGRAFVMVDPFGIRTLRSTNAESLYHSPGISSLR